MTLDQITEQGINPALKLLPPNMDSAQARVMLLTIGMQESRFLHRRQLVTVADSRTGDIVQRPLGPAKSFWQAERAGGMVRGVRTHPATAGLANGLYRARKCPPRDVSIWNAIERDDVLAAGLARLLLWSDPHRLPTLGDMLGAWDLYMRTWRPGKPHFHTWGNFYATAVEFVTGAEM